MEKDNKKQINGHEKFFLGGFAFKIFNIYNTYYLYCFVHKISCYLIKCIYTFLKRVQLDMNLLQSGLESLFKGKNQNMYNKSVSLKYYFESHIIYKWCYYSQTIFNQSNIMVPYVDTIGLCHSVTILWEVYVMRHKCHFRWHNFHFKQMLINTVPGYLTLVRILVFLGTHEIAEEKNILK